MNRIYATIVALLFAVALTPPTSADAACPAPVPPDPTTTTVCEIAEDPLFELGDVSTPRNRGVGARTLGTCVMPFPGDARCIDHVDDARWRCGDAFDWTLLDHRTFGPGGERSSAQQGRAGIWYLGMRLFARGVWCQSIELQADVQPFDGDGNVYGNPYADPRSDVYDIRNLRTTHTSGSGSAGYATAVVRFDVVKKLPVALEAGRTSVSLLTEHKELVFVAATKGGHELGYSG